MIQGSIFLVIIWSMQNEICKPYAELNKNRLEIFFFVPNPITTSQISD